MDASFPARRFFRWKTPLEIEFPSAGGPVDGVTWNHFVSFQGAETITAPRIPGVVIPITTGGAFAAGADLQTDAHGRAVGASTGVVVARALTASPGESGALVVLV